MQLPKLYLGLDPP